MNGAFKGLCSLYFILGFSLKFQVSLFYWKKFYQIQISLKSLNYSKFEVVDSISANAFLTFSIFFIVLCFFPPTSLSLFKCITETFIFPRCISYSLHSLPVLGRGTTFLLRAQPRAALSGRAHQSVAKNLSTAIGYVEICFLNL